LARGLARFMALIGAGRADVAAIEPAALRKRIEGEIAT
jgi:hypothetical protein